MSDVCITEVPTDVTFDAVIDDFPVDKEDPPIDKENPPIDQGNPPIDRENPPIDKENSPIDKTFDKESKSNLKLPISSIDHYKLNERLLEEDELESALVSYSITIPVFWFIETPAA